MKNTQIVLTKRPVGLPRSTDFALAETDIPDIKQGEFLVANKYIGLQPAARIRMGTSTSYAAPTPLGMPPYAQTIGKVVQSRNAAFPEGAAVVSEGGWQSHFVSDGAGTYHLDRRIDPETFGLGCLGASGMTAWVGLYRIAQLKAGQTVVVSAATGAVGSVAGQLARLRGCRVVGIAGGPEKCAFAVEEYGYDACIDHRSDDFEHRLAEACQNGVDIDFENVGGRVRDAIWPLMNQNGQILICGLIAEYNGLDAATGPSWQVALVRRLTIRGFMLRDHNDLRPQFLDEATELVRHGKLKTREDMTIGLENAPTAFIDMLRGKNFGKAIVQVTH